MQAPQAHPWQQSRMGSASVTPTSATSACQCAHYTASIGVQASRCQVSHEQRRGPASYGGRGRHVGRAQVWLTLVCHHWVVRHITHNGFLCRVLSHITEDVLTGAEQLSGMVGQVSQDTMSQWVLVTPLRRQSTAAYSVAVAGYFTSNAAADAAYTACRRRPDGERAALLHCRPAASSEGTQSSDRWSVRSNPYCCLLDFSST